MNTASSTTILTATLRGIRPIMFDRYGGDNKTVLPTLDKFYAQNGILTIPVLNVYSLLGAQNTPSVAKRFYGKQSRDIGLGVNAFVAISAIDCEDEMYAPIIDPEGNAYKVGDSRIEIVRHVARVKDGIPNPKERPMLPTGWSLRLQFEHQDNQLLNVPTLKRVVEQGGILGLGTFRPIYGRYVVSWE